jgi:hypothetical protein
MLLSRFSLYLTSAQEEEEEFLGGALIFLSQFETATGKTMTVIQVVN